MDKSGYEASLCWECAPDVVWNPEIQKFESSDIYVRLILKDSLKIGRKIFLRADLQKLVEIREEKSRAYTTMSYEFFYFFLQLIFHNESRFFKKKPWDIK